MRSSPVVGEAWCLGEPREAYVRSSGRKRAAAVGVVSRAFSMLVGRVSFAGLRPYRGPSLGENSVLRSDPATRGKPRLAESPYFLGFRVVNDNDRRGRCKPCRCRISGVSDRKGCRLHPVFDRFGASGFTYVNPKTGRGKPSAALKLRPHELPLRPRTPRSLPLASRSSPGRRPFPTARSSP